MQLLPRENISFYSKHSPEILVERLVENLASPRGLRIFELFRKRNGKLYKGTIDQHSFQLKRVIAYQNSFQAVIHGKITQDKAGAKIELDIKTSGLNEFTYIIGNIVLCVIFIIMMSISLYRWQIDLYNLIPIGMLMFSYAITMGIFRYESRIAKEYLYKLFEVEG